jgi:hypothetical protein
MNESEAGLFYYDYTLPGTTGDQTLLVKFYNSSGVLGSVSSTLYNGGANVVNTNTTQLKFTCPRYVQTGETFIISANYSYGGLPITGANVTLVDNLTSYNLPYSNSLYQDNFSSDPETTWCIAVTANSSTRDNLTDNCCIIITSGQLLTVKLWEQVDLKVVDNLSGVEITEENYDKELTDPWINDFGYIIARSNENQTGNYSYCNLPFATGQQLMKVLKAMSLVNESTRANLTLPLQQYIGCNQRWYRAEYTQGQADLTLLNPGNYSLYFIDGVMKWDGAYSPPEITKSNMFMWIGDITIPDRQHYTTNFWVSHDELDFWSSWTDGLFLFMTTIIPLLIFLALIFLGVPFQLAGVIALSYETIWMLISFL